MSKCEQIEFFLVSFLCHFFGAFQSHHTRSEWTPLAVTQIVYATLEAAKEVVSQFLSSLDVLPQVTQQQKCTHHLLTTAQCKMEISIIYFKDIVVEFNLLSGCRTTFNSMIRANIRPIRTAFLHLLLVPQLLYVCSNVGMQ